MEGGKKGETTRKRTKKRREKSTTRLGTENGENAGAKLNSFRLDGRKRERKTEDF